MTNIPNFTIRELLDAGVHYGHKTMRWNPKMAPFIYGEKDGVHIIDLQQTAPMLHKALVAIYEVIKNNGKVMFVGTKLQARELIAEAAKSCGQFYVNHRWLGGMLTNWPTVSGSIQRLVKMETSLDDEDFVEKSTKKEVIELNKKREKLDRSFGGIRSMGGQPDLIFVIDTNKESLAIKEAVKLGIPVVAVIDTNSDPDNVTYPIPGNDDATRSIKLYCRLVSEAIIAGIRDGLADSGVDLGEVENIQELLETKDKEASKSRKGGARKPAGRRASEEEGKSDAEARPAKKTAAKPKVTVEKKTTKKPVKKDKAESAE
ncbi:MAG: 30S ribosomal protein S2 [Alphaproteobacteria bacterium]|nr:30S ribosomal protein S2 [Alphaproteobacteria bacterium]OJV15720.1 MAG: 30S ribosomal protein S2 [Alphaproteobacteria bacterium 33-17]